MRLNKERIAEISDMLRGGNLHDEDVLDLIQSHESLREDLAKVESGNIRLWKENEESKGNLQMAVQLMLTMCTDEQLNDIKELGLMTKKQLERMEGKM